MNKPIIINNQSDVESAKRKMDLVVAREEDLLNRKRQLKAELDKVDKALVECTNRARTIAVAIQNATTEAV